MRTNVHRTPSSSHVDFGVERLFNGVLPLAIVRANADGSLGFLLGVGFFAELFDPGSRSTSARAREREKERGGASKKGKGGNEANHRYSLGR